MVCYNEGTEIKSIFKKNQFSIKTNEKKKSMKLLKRAYNVVCLWNVDYKKARPRKILTAAEMWGKIYHWNINEAVLQEADKNLNWLDKLVLESSYILDALCGEKKSLKTLAKVMETEHEDDKAITTRMIQA